MNEYLLLNQGCVLHKLYTIWKYDILSGLNVGIKMLNSKESQLCRDIL